MSDCLVVVAFRDRIADSYGDPVVFPNDAVAVRSFRQTCDQSPIGSDLELYRLGSYDRRLGKFVSLENPSFITSGVSKVSRSFASVPSVRFARSKIPMPHGVKTSMSTGFLYPVEWREVLPVIRLRLTLPLLRVFLPLFCAPFSIISLWTFITSSFRFVWSIRTLQRFWKAFALAV